MQSQEKIEDYQLKFELVEIKVDLQIKIFI